MPELPEVETIRRMLNERIRGKRIDRAVCRAVKIFQIDPRVLEKSLPGQKIRRLDRRGKFLIVRLEGHWLIIHLGMTGQLTYRHRSGRTDKARLFHETAPGKRGTILDEHIHFQIRFQDGADLFFRDVRKFGKIYLLDKKVSLQKEFFTQMGLEPFSAEYRLDAFLEKMKNRNLRIKSLLLDQGFVAGIGNIYADEALFEARIHPARRLRYVRKYEKIRLFEVIPEVLEKGITFGGTTLRDYVKSDGEQGAHQHHLNVYGRRGEPCRLCSTPIEKIVLSQRGTHYCPSCQKR